MQDGRPVVFISYTWEMEESPGHREWVRKLADDLITQYGIIVRLDQYEIALGKPLVYFMETSIEKADKVLSICTPVYKGKAINAEGGVGYEHSLITAKLYQLQAANNKFIPILRRGSQALSIPGYLESLTYQSMLKDDQYEADLQNLAQEIYNYNKIKKPDLGIIPDFDNLPIIDPVMIRGLKQQNQEKLDRQRENYLQSSEARLQSTLEVHQLTNSLEEKVNQYTKATALKLWFTKSEQMGYYDKCVLYTDIGYCIIILWFPDNYNLEHSKLRVRYYKGDVYHEHGRINADSGNPVFSPDQVFFFNVDNNFQSIWRDDKNGEFVNSEELIKNIFLWVLDSKDRFLKKSQRS